VKEEGKLIMVELIIEIQNKRSRPLDKVENLPYSKNSIMYIG
jgi:hypothetical protein